MYVYDETKLRVVLEFILEEKNMLKLSCKRQFFFQASLKQKFKTLFQTGQIYSFINSYIYSLIFILIYNYKSFN